MEDAAFCALCRRQVPLGEGYILRIEVFADPQLPQISSEQLAATDFDAVLRQLLEQMKHMSADELQDGVHRRFEYRLCPACQRRYLANPLGLPRELRVGKN